MKSLSPFWPSRRLVSDFWQELDHMFDNANQESSLQTFQGDFLPAAEVTETEKGFHLSFDLPGLKEEQIQVEVHDNNLIVSGERKREKKFEDEKIRRVEKSYGSFKRSFSLPATVDAERILAQYHNGVLELTLPKTSATKSRKIEVQPGQGNTIEVKNH